MSCLESLERLMREHEPGWWLRLVQEIPELQPLQETPQSVEHHAEGDVAIHTRLAVEACPANCDPDLLWVALLHDIGKPESTVHHEDGRITAHGHATTGSVLAGKILGRLCMPEARRRRIVWAIKHHMFHHSWQLQSPGNLTNRQRAFLDNPDFPLLLDFLRVDTVASHGHAVDAGVYELYERIWSDLPSS